MRNLAVYPVTADEAISAIQIAFEGYCNTVKAHGIGNVDGIAMLMAEKFIEANKDRFNTFSAASLDVVAEKND
jgi:hypothetical protein